MTLKAREHALSDADWVTTDVFEVNFGANPAKLCVVWHWCGY